MKQIFSDEYFVKAYLLVLDVNILVDNDVGWPHLLFTPQGQWFSFCSYRLFFPYSCGSFNSCGWINFELILETPICNEIGIKYKNRD